jgi:hypothetical protein
MKLSFNNIFYPFASCFFILALLLPLTDEIWHYMPKVVNNEQRVLAEMPKLNRDSITLFSKKFENFYQDNFGFRQTLITLASKIKYTIFQSSPIPDKVSIGKDNWLFLSGRFYGITQELTRENLYDSMSLKEQVKTWEERKQELNNKNIKYYKAFWPDKYYIYPEFMSYGMKWTDRNDLHRCDQAIEYLANKKSTVKIIDVRSELLELKKRYRIYHKNDSHWNSYGAFYAYTSLMNIISIDFPSLKPASLTSFNITWTDKRQGDLANILNVNKLEIEPIFTEKGRTYFKQIIPNNDYPLKTLIYINDSASTKLKALVYRDSFTSAMIPFLATHFSEIIFIWDTDYSIKMIEKVKPDIVIECYASRYFR